jgi:hypothetical protein
MRWHHRPAALGQTHAAQEIESPMTISIPRQSGTTSSNPACSSGESATNRAAPLTVDREDREIRLPPLVAVIGIRPDVTRRRSRGCTSSNGRPRCRERRLSHNTRSPTCQILGEGDLLGIGARPSQDATAMPSDRAPAKPHSRILSTSSCVCHQKPAREITPKEPDRKQKFPTMTVPASSCHFC